MTNTNDAMQAIENAGTLEELTTVAVAYGFSLVDAADELTEFVYFDASEQENEELTEILEGKQADYFWETGSGISCDFYAGGTQKELEAAAIEWLEEADLSAVKRSLISEYCN